MRLALAGASSVGLLLALGVPACSGTNKKQVQYVAEAGSAGEADASSTAAGSAGHAGHSGASGTGGNAGDAGESGSSGEANAGSGPSGGASGSAGSAASAGSAGTSASGGTSGSAGQPIVIPDIDAGSDCLPPDDDTQLSAVDAGLPSTGLALWLRADHGVYMTLDHRVCAWVDQSGGQRVFTPVSGRSLWVDASIGTRAAINIDATGGPLSVAGVLGLPPTSARTLVAVVKLTETTSRFQALMQGQDQSYGTYLNLDANSFHTAGSREGVYIDNNSYDASLATSTDARLHVYEIATMTVGQPVLSSINYRVNGVPLTLTRNDGGLGNGNFEDFSNAGFTLVGNGHTGLIAEALIYDHVLGTSELGQLEGALEARYGIIPPD